MHVVAWRSHQHQNRTKKAELDWPEPSAGIVQPHEGHTAVCGDHMGAMQPWVATLAWQGAARFLPFTWCWASYMVSLGFNQDENAPQNTLQCFLRFQMLFRCPETKLAQTT